MNKEGFPEFKIFKNNCSKEIMLELLFLFTKKGFEVNVDLWNEEPEEYTFEAHYEFDSEDFVLKNLNEINELKENYSDLHFSLGNDFFKLLNKEIVLEIEVGMSKMQELSQITLKYDELGFRFDISFLENSGNINYYHANCEREYINIEDLKKIMNIINNDIENDKILWFCIKFKDSKDDIYYKHSNGHNIDCMFNNIEDVYTFLGYNEKETVECKFSHIDNFSVGELNEVYNIGNEVIYVSKLNDKIKFIQSEKYDDSGKEVVSSMIWYGKVEK